MATDNRDPATAECGYFDRLEESGLVGADRWRVGLVRLAAQKREQQRRETVVQGAVEKGGVGVPAGDH